ncbi:ImmA/IrrE family metallo-endopeptidase [Lentibacillus sp. Marseille-P4043]|uniref:ImmA/IrrE family metallo-endopeptidase n=1 Tax=Lentibacillus sp. Marseille-P4043 TaxID=2040293 RepID=UPI000D0B8F41|nr:ImmA/IrrE family metallo-endopeptidase [Lentibacillus sp. Marseille-P4043]
MIHYTRLEDYIRDLYINLSINCPEQLGVESLAKALNLKIYYADANMRFNDTIVLKKTSIQQEWQSFGHEVGHYLLHVGNQLVMHYLFNELQENQANYFAYHFCIPTFMLSDSRVKNVYEVMNLFNVEFEFAQRRLSMYQSKFIYEVTDHAL